MRTPLIGGNWKMDEPPTGANSFFETFRRLVEGSSHCEIVICPSFLDVRIAVTAARRTRIQIGVQNIYWEKDGAFTGEVSGSAIKASGCSHVIVGHSERRKSFGETDAIVFKKTLAAIDAHLIPIVCIGERENGNAQAALTEQFEHAIGLLSEEQLEQIVVAYEPIWAIGSGAAATPETAADAHCFIRAQAKSSFGAKAAGCLRIIYGGSVKPDNAEALIAQTDIDGFLVGGASLDPLSFAAIVNC